MKKIKLENNKNGIGFTTNTFAKLIESGEMDYKDILEFAKQNGFSFVEIRDTKISLTEEQLLKIKNDADSLDLKLHYAFSGINLLDEQDDYIVKGIKNTTKLGNDVYCRIIIAPKVILESSSKVGYTYDEFKMIRNKMKAYIEVAKVNQIKLCFENAAEPISGEKNKYVGIKEILDYSSEFDLCFDPANFTTNGMCKVTITSDDIYKFAKGYIKQIPYMHLKTTEKGIVMSSLAINSDFDVPRIMNILSDNKDLLFILELPIGSSFEEISGNIKTSIQLLLDNKVLTTI